jgi:hypothetical protein
MAKKKGLPTIRLAHKWKYLLLTGENGMESGMELQPGEIMEVPYHSSVGMTPEFRVYRCRKGERP